MLCKGNQLLRLERKGMVNPKYFLKIGVHIGENCVILYPKISQEREVIVCEEPGKETISVLDAGWLWRYQPERDFLLLVVSTAERGRDSVKDCGDSKTFYLWRRYCLSAAAYV